MKRNYIVTCSRWAPVALWMSLIFLFSTELLSSSNTSSFLESLLQSLLPSVSNQSVENANFALRKLGHWCEYFVLAVLLARAFHAEAVPASVKRRMMWTIILVVVYAASDELHQAFVPGRAAALTDVLLDSFGGLCGAFCFEWRRQRTARRQKLS